MAHAKCFMRHFLCELDGNKYDIYKVKYQMATCFATIASIIYIFQYQLITKYKNDRRPCSSVTGRSEERLSLRFLALLHDVPAEFAAVHPN